MKKIALGLAALVLLLCLAVIPNALRSGPAAAGASVAPVAVTVDSAGAIQRLSKALTFATVSYEEGTQPPDSAAFRALHEHLRVSFPLVHAAMTREVVDGLSLLYTWKGSDTTLAPVVLMGHLDVVPVIPGTETRWTHPPFSGDIADGYVWGRGSLDDKVSVLSLLEGAEAALKNGFAPKRTIYFAFGHDEEVGGKGARALKATLMGRGIKHPAMVVDEGGAIAPGSLVGANGTVALIGTSEKGFLSLQLTVQGAGGHSSTPPAHTAIGRLATAITKLEASPFPAVLDGPTRQMLETVRSTMPFSKRLVLSNLWLFGGVVKAGMLKSTSSAAMLRTTTAVTIVGGGVKTNVLPIEAKATVNFRIRPGETIESVTARVAQVIGDTGVKIEAVGFKTDPSPVSDPTGSGFKTIEKSLREIMPATELTVTPYLVVGGTDARTWSDVSTQTFRFIAAPVEADALTRVHGTNERVGFAGYTTAIRFWVRLLNNTNDLQ